MGNIMVVEGETCLQLSDSENGSHALMATVCTYQACAIQERVLCGHWSTEHALRGTAHWDWQAPGTWHTLGP